MNTQLKGKYVLSGKIRCITGLHIGGSTTGVEIGGVDNPVIKDPLSEEPYIPGSGLKGKLRSLAEWSLGLIEEHAKHQGTYAAYACSELIGPEPPKNTREYQRYHNALQLGRLFGASNDKSEVRMVAGPSRLIVRDAFLNPTSREALQDSLGLRLFTEVKTENALDRVTSEANPRPLERVPAGSTFDINFILDIYEPDDCQLFRLLFASMRLLENSSLGGSGSRGSGQIQFEDLSLVWRPVDYYKIGIPEQHVKLPENPLESLTKDFDQITWPG